MENEKDIIKNKLQRLKEIINTEKDLTYSMSKTFIKDLLDNTSFQMSCTESLTSLVDLCFVITEHPRRLIKKGTICQTGTQFEATISCILESKKIKVKMIGINTNLVNVASDGFQLKEISSKIESVGFHKWVIKNMRFKSVDNKRASKRTIFDKSVIIFDLKFEIQALNFLKSCTKKLYSETVVVIVHSSQEPEAELTLFIDDYFRTDRQSFVEGRGFHHLDSTTCTELVGCISDYFSKETGRKLTELNCKYLVTKARNHFKSEDVQVIDFIKTPLIRSKISFGLWIILVARLCKNDHVHKLWLNDFIEGFISKDVCSILNETGSFLLRFSEKSAAIGVVVKAEYDIIKPWTPFTDVECKKMNIANHLYEFSCLTLIRKADGTMISKDDALSEFIDVADVDDGYTARGGLAVSQSSVEDELSVGSPMTDDIECINDRTFQDVNEEDFNFDEMLEICDSLLKQ